MHYDFTNNCKLKIYKSRNGEVKTLLAPISINNWRCRCGCKIWRDGTTEYTRAVKIDLSKIEIEDPNNLRPDLKTKCIRELKVYQQRLKCSNRVCTECIFERREKIDGQKKIDGHSVNVFMLMGMIPREIESDITMDLVDDLHEIKKEIEKFIKAKQISYFDYERDLQALYDFSPIAKSFKNTYANAFYYISEYILSGRNKLIHSVGIIKEAVENIITNNQNLVERQEKEQAFNAKLQQPSLIEKTENISSITNKDEPTKLANIVANWSSYFSLILSTLPRFSFNFMANKIAFST